MNDNHATLTRLGNRTAEVDRLDSTLHDAKGLVTALQIVCGEFSQKTIKDKHLDKIRSAIVALSDALEIKLADEETGNA